VSSLLIGLKSDNSAIAKRMVSPQHARGELCCHT